MAYIKISACPICGSSKFKKKLDVNDYSISNEAFGLVACATCSFVITSPRPSDDRLFDYYKSDDYISHSGTKKGLVNKLYHQFQKLNLQLKFKALSKHVPRGTWMDYGAGNGAFLNFLKSRHISSEGFEPDDQARAIAAKKGTKIQDSKIYTSDSKEYSAITMWHVLEHIPNLNEIISTHYTNLMNDGILAIAVPNYLSYDSCFYKNYWAALDVPRHLWHFSEKDIKALLIKHGFDHVQTKPMPFDSYYVSMLSEKYQKGFLLRGGFIGMISNIYARISGYPFSSQIYIFRKKPI